MAVGSWCIGRQSKGCRLNSIAAHGSAAVLTVRPAELPSRPLAKTGLPVDCLCVRMS